MKKKFVTLLVLFCTLFAVFSAGIPEEQKILLENLPGIVNQEKKTGITTLDTPQSKQGYSTTRGNAIIDRDMASLTRLYKYLEQNYLWDIDYTSVYDAMAKAMFDSLGDKYTYYVTSENTEKYNEAVSGKYGGLGFYFTKTHPDSKNAEKEETLYINIEQVFPNTPAAKAGMAAGDFITHINGKSVEDMTSSECQSIMKGNVGEEVNVTVKRKSAVFDLTMIRSIITVPDIEYSMINNDTGYLYILRFYSGTFRQVKSAIETLIAGGMKKLIIDLRECPGGDVDSTLSIADMFISDKKLLTVNFKDKTKTKTMMASSSTIVDPDVKVVILINGGSASSAEIFASTMRDNERAVLIGQTSYGKGVMQNITVWGDADTSVTIASFIPPSGKEIHKVGVVPDVVTQPSVVQENEIEIYTELYKSSKIRNFVDMHPVYSKENVELFVSEHPEISLRPEVVKIMIRNEYYSRMTYDQRPKVDKWFDVEIQKALEVLGRQ